MDLRGFIDSNIGKSESYKQSKVHLRHSRMRKNLRLHSIWVCIRRAKNYYQAGLDLDPVEVKVIINLLLSLSPTELTQYSLPSKCDKK